MLGILKYSSNNSGGSWWLKDKDWSALSKAGWIVHWVKANGDTPNAYDVDKLLIKSRKSKGKWLDASATSCAKEFDSAKEGINEWEKIIGQDSTDVGCNCCGNPHDFIWYIDGEENYLNLDIPSKGSWNY